MVLASGLQWIVAVCDRARHGGERGGEWARIKGRMGKPKWETNLG